ncbi:MAG: hypothetical protein ACREOL_10080 [Candidatus Dormibacteria bacterium]
MGAFGHVPGLTIVTLASVMLLGVTYLGCATIISWSREGQAIWKAVVFPVLFMFALTVALVLVTAIAENQFANRITGG